MTTQPDPLDDGLHEHIHEGEARQAKFAAIADGLDLPPGLPDDLSREAIDTLTASAVAAMEARAEQTAAELSEGLPDGMRVVFGPFQTDLSDDELVAFGVAPMWIDADGAPRVGKPPDGVWHDFGDHIPRAVLEAMEDELADEFRADTGAERFEIDDGAKCQWALRKMAAAKNELDRLTVLADAEHRRINEWHEAATRPVEADYDRLATMLRPYLEGLHDQDPERRTWKYPSGELRARKQPDRLEVVDADALVEFALAYRRDLVKITPAVQQIKDATVRDGSDVELRDGDKVLAVPGVEWVTGDDKLSVKPT